MDTSILTPLDELGFVLDRCDAMAQMGMHSITDLDAVSQSVYFGQLSEMITRCVELSHELQSAEGERSGAELAKRVAADTLWSERVQQIAVEILARQTSPDVSVA